MRRIRLGGTDGPSLMLTPLLDMFTIILIFLLVSLDSDMAEFKRGVAELPDSYTRAAFVPAVNVELTSRYLRIDPVPGVADRDGAGNVIPWTVVLELNDGVVDARYYAEGKIEPLVTLLKAHYADRQLRYEKRLQTAAESEEAPAREEPILLIQADQTIPYKTLYLVLESAQAAEFGKFRLATVQRTGT